MKDLAFGQFYPTKSFVHNMDARIKILCVIAFIVAVFLVTPFHFLTRRKGLNVKKRKKSNRCKKSRRNKKT